MSSRDPFTFEDLTVAIARFPKHTAMCIYQWSPAEIARLPRDAQEALFRSLIAVVANITLPMQDLFVLMT